MRSPARQRGTPTGRVVTRQGPVLTVQTPEGELIACIGQGKGKRAVVGDTVFTRPVNTDLANAAIVDIAPRRNELARADGTGQRPRVIAANVDRLVVVVAVQPPIRPGLIDRLLVAAHAQGIEGRIVLNKIDLLDRDLKEEAELLLSPYPPIGYPVLPVSARTGKNMDELAEWLSTGTSVLVGHPASARPACSTACARAWESGSGRAERGQRPGGPHHHQRLALRAAGRRRGHRQPRHPHVRALGHGARGPGGALRRLRAVRRRLPVRQLPPRPRARLRGEAGGGRRPHQRRALRLLPAPARDAGRGELRGGRDW
ncbi:MAG: GTPase RsgA [bacterium]